MKQNVTLGGAVISQEALIAVIGAGSALLGAVVGAIGSYKAAQIGFNARKLKSGFRTALNDILAFHEIEQRYVASLAETTSDAPKAIKDRVRNEVREASGRELSENSQPRRVEKKLAALGVE